MQTEVDDERRVIVVGVDWSAPSVQALRWAAQDASRSGAVLRIVSVWAMPGAEWLAGTVGIEPDDVRAGAQHVVEEARDLVSAELGPAGPEVETEVVVGGVAGGLIAQSEGADLLVVGTRGRGGLLAVALGSVALACAHHSTVPVAVVGGEARDPGTGDLVVGFDGSVGAQRALRWACAHAARLGVGVRVVQGLGEPDAIGADVPDPVRLEATARSALQRSVDQELAAIVDPPAVEAVVVTASPVEALAGEARGAGLLVVGSRGRGGFAGLLLGSVSQGCLHAAPCPVAIVPTTP